RGKPPEPRPSGLPGPFGRPGQPPVPSGPESLVRKRMTRKRFQRESPEESEAAISPPCSCSLSAPSLRVRHSSPSMRKRSAAPLWVTDTVVPSEVLHGNSPSSSAWPSSTRVADHDPALGLAVTDQ